MQPENVNEGIVRFFEPANPEFDQDFADDSRVLGGVDYSLDIRTRYDIGQSTPVYADSGRRLLKLKAQDGSQVFIRGAKVQMEGDTVQITFNRQDQLTHAQKYTQSQIAKLWTPEMQKQLEAETQAIENKAFLDTAVQVAGLAEEKVAPITCPEFVDKIDELPPVCRTCGESYAEAGDGYDGECPTCADKAAEREEIDPVFVLWEGGSIEKFVNDDEAREELMAMESRGCKGLKYSSREEAEDALAAMAAAFIKKTQ